MRFYLMIGILLCFSCIHTPQQSPLKSFQIQGLAQGTSYQIRYFATKEVVAKPQIEQVLSSIDSSLSIYKSYSLISQFNRAESGLKMDPHLKRVVKKSLEISKSTGGVFDITIQPLVQAWGFGTEAIAALPDSATIHFLLQCTGPDKIRIHQNYLVKELPCVKIDVNGIAQGYTVDVLADFLERKGIHNYLVELGGEIRIKGRKPDGTQMTIGIEGPGENERQLSPIQTVIQPPYGAVTTSGNYRKFLEVGPHKISHLIDPSTGYPIRNKLISATVWARDALTADGYDNALMGMEIKQALEFVDQKKGMEAYLIYRKEDGTVADTATTGFYKMMKK